MLHIFFTRLSLLAIISLFLFSCAHNQTSKARRSRKVQSKRTTPSSIINNYKVESHRRDLDNIIGQKNYSKPSFLKKTNSSKVRMWKKYFTGRGRESYKKYLLNGEKYRPLIERTFTKHGLPKELYFVGLIESGYYIKARSHADAVGPWQFIKSTGKRYGLKIRHDVDERFSIVKSTEAAALFFGDLYNIFGSWELALSAYNAGEYGIIRRIRKARTRDFYELSRRKKIPKETRNYVPKILAAMEIYKNAKKYNITIPLYKNDSFEDIKTVTIKRSTYIKNLARQYGVKLSRLKHLNMDLKRNATPSGSYNLILPTSSKFTKFKKSSRKVNRQIAKVKTKFFNYKIKKGDNLSRIAKRNRTTISSIIQLNNLRKKTVYIGQRLKIPKKRSKTYTVKPGDFLLKIAQKHNLTISKLKRINSITSSKIFPGQKLIVSNQ